MAFVWLKKSVSEQEQAWDGFINGVNLSKINFNNQTLVC